MIKPIIQKLDDMILLLTAGADPQRVLPYLNEVSMELREADRQFEIQRGLKRVIWAIQEWRRAGRRPPR